MKIVVQRVAQASVEVEGQTVAKIGMGALVLLGVTHSDTLNEAAWLANKLVNLRMFKDSQGKINASLLDCHGEVLVVSQFTLYADCGNGRRPSFTAAAQPEQANLLYEQFVEEVAKSGLIVQKGIFGAEMKVSLINDGPVTLIVEKNG
jgi:D-aminoacyl-tRNA deacylase